jgi:monoterpene epsilon-lactone hydrolase
MSQQQRAAVDARLRAGGSINGGSPPELRQAFAALMAGPAPSGVTLADTTLGGRPALEFTLEDGAVGGAAAETILYFHGGSWVVGSPATAQGLTAALVRRRPQRQHRPGRPGRGHAPGRRGGGLLTRAGRHPQR